MSWKEVDGDVRCVCDYCGKIMGTPISHVPSDVPPKVQEEMDRTGRKHVCAECLTNMS